MRSNNHKCTLQGTSITFGGRVYQYKDLNNLPFGSRLEDTKMIECNEGQEICFQSELSYLSNFYYTPFYYKDKLFTSAEQAFQWAKAIAADYHHTAKSILALEDPYEIKHLSFDVPQTEQWSRSEVDTMRAIVYAKFSQNRAINERLRLTTYTRFHECTTNSHWGTGVSLPISSREIDHTKFAGENHLGVILSEVRTRLRKDALRAAGTVSSQNSSTTNTAGKPPARTSLGSATPGKSSNKKQ